MIIQMKAIEHQFHVVLSRLPFKLVLILKRSNLKIQMDNMISVHVFHALQYLLHVPHNFLLREVVIIADFFEQLTSGNSAKRQRNDKQTLICRIFTNFELKHYRWISLN